MSRSIKKMVAFGEKCPDMNVFQALEDVEAYIEQSTRLSDAADSAYAKYQQAASGRNYSTALDQLILIGEFLEFPAQYWCILQRLTGPIWSSNLDLVKNRKARGQLETKAEFIDRRANGDRQWNPKLGIE